MTDIAKLIEDLRKFAAELPKLSGHLMDIRAKVKNPNPYDSYAAGLCTDCEGLMLDAAAALKELQAENERLREQLESPPCPACGVHVGFDCFGGTRLSNESIWRG